MFLQTLPFSFHTRAVPIILITVVCQDMNLTETRMVRDVLVTDTGVLLMLFVCSLADKIYVIYFIFYIRIYLFLYIYNNI